VKIIGIIYLILKYIPYVIRFIEEIHKGDDKRKLEKFKNAKTGREAAVHLNDLFK